MPTDDQSLATQVENWIVTTIEAITDTGTVFEDVEVAPWDGSDEQMIDYLGTHIDEGHRDLTVRVRFSRDVVTPLEADQIRREAMYDVWVAIKNVRPDGQARRGDGTKPGTNRMRELLVDALHGKRPSSEGTLLNNLGWASDYLFFRGCEIIWHTKGKATMLCKFTCHEVEATFA